MALVLIVATLPWLAIALLLSLGRRRKWRNPSSWQELDKAAATQDGRAAFD